MTPEQKTLVQESFARLAPLTEAAAELFYGRLFELDPTLRSLFAGDLRSQGRKLVQTLAVAVLGLDYFERLVPVLEDLGRRHVQYGVLPEHYRLVKDALLWMLEQTLGDDLTWEAHVAWASMYDLLASTMLGAVAETV